MSERVEAAANAIRLSGSDWCHGQAQAVLAAADAVMFSDAAVERAARAMLDGLYSDKTLQTDDEDRGIIREIIAALKGDDE